MEGNRTSWRLPLQAEGEDPTQDGVISRMNHHLVLILTEVLDRIALTGVAIKGQNHELLGKFIFHYVLREGRVGCIGGDGFESAVMWHPHLFESLLYKLIEIMDIDKLHSFPSRMIMSILHIGKRQT